ncbi:PREDICTED: cytochrome b-c1 complex subunit 8-like isoform X1 [Tarenaya hassleriana]|uniref:cytochrome b-c1 complex subunit 8-like isoform X1 n=1 Tax=Tarenaya hassleriana TaxID=28532 RepID=UPI0008FD70E6|nr:PREDICTED: cytochrome b-c1 complex subunit 8-like isoform X1 [Tarenaya hassleriana]
MGKQPVRMKAVVYALSPFQQKVMTGLWKDLPEKIHHKVSENWISATLLLSPVLGTYCMSFCFVCDGACCMFICLFRSLSRYHRP